MIIWIAYLFLHRKLDLRCWTKREKKYQETKVTSKCLLISTSNISSFYDVAKRPTHLVLLYLNSNLKVISFARFNAFLVITSLLLPIMLFDVACHSKCSYFICYTADVHNSCYDKYVLDVRPHAGYGVVRIDLLCFLAGCRKRRLN